MDAQIWKIGQKTNGGSLIARLSSDYFLHGVAAVMYFISGVFVALFII